MIGDGTPVFVPGHKRYRVHQGGVPSYVIVGPTGLVTGCDREPWLHMSWKKLRARLASRATIEDLDAEDAGAGEVEAAGPLAG